MTEYRLVPVEPTAEMMAAGKYALEAGCYASGIYADMLAAAPAVQGEPVVSAGWAADAIRDAHLEGQRSATGRYHSLFRWNNSESHAVFLRLLSGSQPAEQKPVVCVGCEGAPKPENSPCAVCGQQPAPDVAGLVEAAEAALGEIEDIMQEAYNSAYPVCCGRPGSECCGSPEPEWEETDQRMMDRLAPHQKALREALAAHRKGGDV